jgi:hydroxymethylpyrimidine/phosphomethylpyrimidine kinase
MHTLTPSSALHAIITKLLPLGILVTPNVGEAQALHAGIRKIESVDGPEQEIEIKNIKDMVFAAEAILDYISSRNKNSENSRGVLLKGGHLPLEAANLSSALRDIKNLPDYVEVVWGADSLGLGTELEPENDACFEVLRQYRSEQATKAVSDTSLQIVVPTASTSDGVQPPPALTGKKYIVDVLVTYQPGETSCKTVLFVSEAIDSRSTHGTGCTLSAAIATKIGHGQTRQ